MYAFEKFITWCLKFNLSFLPASPVPIALYLVSVIQMKHHSCGKSKINHIFYAINWAHETAHFKENPCQDRWLRLCLEGCIQKISRPVQKKEPITPDVLKLFITSFVSERCSLADLRIVTLFVLCFAGFLRISEALCLKRCHIEFKDDHCSICIENAKTDVYREGNFVVLAKTGKFSCPVQLLYRYISEAGLMECYDQFIFRAVVLCKKTNKYVLKRKNVPLSYTRTRELFNQKTFFTGAG